MGGWHLKKPLKNMLSNQELFSLINVANIHSGLLRDNLITSPEKFSEFSDQMKGVPILIPADQQLFNFENKDVFELPAKQILKLVYGISDEAYVGFKHAFNQFTFLTSFEVKEDYKSYLDEMIQQNLDIVTYVTSLKKKFKHIRSFQTRKIPHFGHEKIIQRMLDSCDHIVINPVIGPKKKVM